MALAKIYRITDCNGENWLIQAASFSEAERKFLEWESTDFPEETTELIDGIVASREDLILGGTRDDSIGSYEQIGFHPVPYPPQDWTLANQLCAAAENLIKRLTTDLSPDTSMRDLMAALQIAIEKYNEIPF